MRRSSLLQLPLELAYSRKVLFAIELLDAVTMERVTEGIAVEAEGLSGKPIVNSGGVFVWRTEDFEKLKRLIINPGFRPYERVEREKADVQRPLTSIELPPRVDYPFSTGVTGLRGTLIESTVADPGDAEPVRDAKVRLRWLDEDGAWREAPTKSTPNENSGAFAAILRLAPNDAPLLDDEGRATVRLHVSRVGQADRRSNDFKLKQGRVTNPSTEQPLTFVWDDLIR